MNGKFKVQLVVDYEMDEIIAAHILSDPKPKQALADWLNERGASELEASGYCCDELRKAFGLHLAKRKIEQTRQLAVSSV